MSILDELENAWRKELRPDDLKIVDAFETDGKDASEEVIRYFAFGYLEGKRNGLAAGRFDDTAKGIQGHVTELKPDRRAEVLELAGRLAPLADTLARMWNPDEAGRKFETYLVAFHSAAYRAAHTADSLADITSINVADESTGVKATEPDPGYAAALVDIAAHLERITSAVGPYPYLDGKDVISDTYAVLRKHKDIIAEARVKL